jgi:methylated-DNA-protein-cysteine methyltransferase related protein
MASEFRKRIYGVVAAIPEGRVATYGQVAALAGRPGAARQVGYALAAAPRAMQLPWQRVINAKGEISPRADSADQDYQRVLLEAEGVQFDLHARISLSEYGWDGCLDLRQLDGLEED